ncbi:MAG: dihydrolipoamide acetyltransferase family protein [Bdellovibrionota bacterium]
MATEIKMPQLSDTMDSGKILSWSKQEGDPVSRGDILAEVETDKANLEIESFHNGVLLKIVTPADSSAVVGETIAYIGEAGEVVPGANGTRSNGNAVSATTASTALPSIEPARTTSSEVTSETPVYTNGNGSSSSAPQHSTISTETSGRIKASPLAKKLASEKGIDLTTIQGTGPDGRIVKKDLEGARTAAAITLAPPVTPVPSSVPAAAAPQAPESTPQQGASQADGGALVPFSKMRATIAKRMQQSVTEAPHFYVTTSVNMDNVMSLRKLLKEKKGFERTSINHFVLRAAAYGIAAEPRVNYAVRDDQFVFQPADINVGIITAIEDGLLIPVIKNADRISFQDLVFEANAAVERARAGRPNAQDLLGGTFSISNMGMFDVDSFTAIINPGQGSVLAVSSIKEQPIAENGTLRIANMMKVTISVDHRIIDGVMAGNFLKAFKEALENPALLLL